MTTIESLGFFAENYEKIKKLISPNDINVLGSLKDDLERIKYVDKLSAISENRVPIKRECSGKSEEESQKLKKFGNDAFRNKKWIEAMVFYSKSYIAMPSDKGADIAILLANRSATLFHLEKYSDCLADIQRAIEYGYPKDMLYKIYERRAQCHLASKNFTNALEAFKNTITSLDDTNLPLEKRSQIERNSLIMIKMIEKDKIPNTPNQKSVKKASNKMEEFVSDAVEIDQNVEEGRYATAKRNIQVGEGILAEKPYAFALLEKFCKTHCQNCLRRTIVPLACPTCADVIFCSELCLKEGLKNYHQYECGILPTVWRSGISINCLLALRMTALKTPEYYTEALPKFSEELSLEKLKKLPQSDYRRVYNLVRHADKRSETSFFQYCLMSLFLNDCLNEGGYYKRNPDLEQKQLVASLIMRNLQILQYNTHEIFELHKSGAVNEAKKTVFIGGGIYPTLALFNHSCDPGIGKYFNGTTVCVHAVKPIAIGEIIAENYGPLYTQEIREQRRAKMKDLYQFDCNCTACLKNWPRFEEMRNDVIRIRCDSEHKCSNVSEVPLDTNEFMIKCIECGQLTNILKALKVMQDSVMIDKTAKRLADAGEIQKALEKYIDKLKIMHEVVAPPFTDYSQCQQNIKDCFLHFGNSYIAAE